MAWWKHIPRYPRPEDYEPRPRYGTRVTVVLYHYDVNGNLISETDEQGNALREYLWVDDQPVAQITGSDIVYLHTDHLYTPRLASSSEGAVVWRWRSDAYGVGLAEDDVDGDTVKTEVNLRFPGQYFDAETELHYNWHRYYEPQTGRYISSDPIGLAGGFNTYAYVENNPLRWIDSNGLVAQCLAAPARLGWAIGEVISYGITAATGLTLGTAIYDVVHNNGESVAADGNSNPYDGPIDTPVVVVDQHGNAIPVEAGQQVQTFPDGDYQQVLDANGKPTGDRLYRGGHMNQKDPRARDPHGHRPNVTTPDGNKHLPIYP